MPRPLAIIGNVNVDIIVGDCPATLHPGTESMVAHGDVRPAGCVGNTALAWMALDMPFQVAANTGNDMFGDWLRTIFRAHSGAWPRESCATTFSVGIAHPDSERTFLTTHGHIEKLSLEEVKRALDFNALGGGIALLVGGFLMDRLSADYPGLFDLLAKHRIEVALDTGWPITGWTPEIRAQCLGWVAHTHHLLMNEVELLSLFEVPEVEDAMMAALRVDAQGRPCHRQARAARRLRPARRQHGPCAGAGGEGGRHHRRGRRVQRRLPGGDRQGRELRRCDRRRRGDRVARDLDPSTGICRAAGAAS